MGVVILTLLKSLLRLSLLIQEANSSGMYETIDNVIQMMAPAKVVTKIKRNPKKIVAVNETTISQSKRSITDFPIMLVEIITIITGPAANHSPHTTAGVATLELKVLLVATSAKIN